MQCCQYVKGVDEQGRVYQQYTDFGNKTSRGLKHLKVDNKIVQQYENSEDEEHCVVNIFEKNLSYIPSRDSFFTFVQELMMDLLFLSLLISLWEEIDKDKSFQRCAEQLVLKAERQGTLVRSPVPQFYINKNFQTRSFKNVQVTIL